MPTATLTTHTAVSVSVGGQQLLLDHSGVAWLPDSGDLILRHGIAESAEDAAGDTAIPDSGIPVGEICGYYHPKADGGNSRPDAAAAFRRCRAARG